jgi:hypothetical protein
VPLIGCGEGSGPPLSYSVKEQVMAKKMGKSGVASKMGGKPSFGKGSVKTDQLNFKKDANVGQGGGKK